MQLDGMKQVLHQNLLDLNLSSWYNFLQTLPQIFVLIHTPETTQYFKINIVKIALPFQLIFNNVSPLWFSCMMTGILFSNICPFICCSVHSMTRNHERSANDILLLLLKICWYIHILIKFCSCPSVSLKKCDCQTIATFMGWWQTCYKPVSS